MREAEEFFFPLAFSFFWFAKERGRERDEKTKNSPPILPILFSSPQKNSHSYNPAYGARPLRRAIMRLLEDSMAERMLSGDIKEGDAVIIDVDADGSVSVLNGDKKMTTAIDSTPAGIS